MARHAVPQAGEGVFAAPDAEAPAAPEQGGPLGAHPDTEQAGSGSARVSTATIAFGVDSAAPLTRRARREAERFAVVPAAAPLLPSVAQPAVVARADGPSPDSPHAATRLSGSDQLLSVPVRHETPQATSAAVADGPSPRKAEALYLSSSPATPPLLAVAPIAGAPVFSLSRDSVDPLPATSVGPAPGAPERCRVRDLVVEPLDLVQAVRSRRARRTAVADEGDLRVPSRFPVQHHADPDGFTGRWPRRIRVMTTLLATGVLATSALPAYAADPTQVAVVAPTTLVAIVDDSPQQNYAVDEKGATADLSRNVVSLQLEATAAPDTKALTKACTVAGSNMSGSIVYPLPSQAYHLTSGIGYRYIASLGRGEYHTGQDFAAPLTTSIFAIADGTVTEIGNAAGATYVKIRSVLPTGETIDSYYLHEYSDGVFVQAGETVTAGQKIAEVGNAGISTGPHMHLEIHDASGGETKLTERSTLLDPLAWLKAHGAVSAGGC